jgi:hypothetical protein
MLDAATCKKVLNSGERIYSDQEVELIASLLWELAEISVEYYMDLKTNENESNTEPKSEL